MTEQAIEHENDPLQPGQRCMAVQDFDGQEEGDLPFKIGEKIIIVEPCELVFWYKARNEGGSTGVVPRPFLVPVEDAPPPPLPPKETTPTQVPVGGYVQMSSAVPIVTQGVTREGYLHINPSTFQQNSNDPDDRRAFIAQEKEKRRRLKPGTLVMGICQFVGQEADDLSFNVYEEMMIINPLPDLCWYTAQKTDHPEAKGSVPITHTTLVYISDDEDDFSDHKVSSAPAHDMLYDDINDFVRQSGWFSYPGLAHGKVALQHVLASKCKLSHQQYMTCQRAVYRMTYRQDEKVYIGKAHVLHEELSKHFDCFNKKREEIREIDDELCHHTEMSGWDLTVWVLEDEDDLDVECGKKSIEHNALVSKDGNGITEEMSFGNRGAFDKFWDWFMPN
ncbi:uncharacterized protein LOC135349648 [Halichondria panicea]|uniref:uncharacterized protein LOC135349648 n=1 Tax=Halichondria panicea TaxID=6063 RepID=UPI00312B32CE